MKKHHALIASTMFAVLALAGCSTTTDDELPAPDGLTVIDLGNDAETGWSQHEIKTGDGRTVTCLKYGYPTSNVHSGGSISCDWEHARTKEIAKRQHT